MKAWWQQLNSREQRLVASMGLVAIIFIFYSAIWQPLNSNIDKANEKLVRQQALLTWVTDNTARYQQAKKNGSTGKSKTSLSSIVNSSANTYKLSITRIQPQGEDIQVWIDTAPFTQLLFWLEHLANNEGLQVKNIDLSRADRAGEVRVRRLHLSKL
ncbi:MAG: type II secretion system protein M [Colwellia sp.]